MLFRSGLDVTLEDENGEEVKLLETSEYGNTDLNAIISGDRNFNYEEKESFGAMGFSKQEFNENEELVDVEEEPESDDDFDMNFEENDDYDFGDSSDDE